jgi:hypothetical protein
MGDVVVVVVVVVVCPISTVAFWILPLPFFILKLTV